MMNGGGTCQSARGDYQSLAQAGIDYLTGTERLGKQQKPESLPKVRTLGKSGRCAGVARDQLAVPTDAYYPTSKR